MGDDATIRSAERTDVEAVQRVARAAWHAAYDDVLGPDRVDETVDSWYDPERLVEDDVADPARAFVVATVDDSIVGFAEAVPDAETSTDEDDPDEDLVHLYRLYVTPDHWGEGVGTALLEHVETVFADRGFTELTLTVMAANEVGVGFYESRGFERVDAFHDDQLDIEEYEYRKPIEAVTDRERR